MVVLSCGGGGCGGAEADSGLGRQGRGIEDRRASSSCHTELMCLVLLGVPPDAGQSPRVPAVDTIDHTISPCCLDGGDHSERLLGTSEVETMGVRLLCVHTAACWKKQGPDALATASFVHACRHALDADSCAVWGRAGAMSMAADPLHFRALNPCRSLHPPSQARKPVDVSCTLLSGDVASSSRPRGLTPPRDGRLRRFDSPQACPAASRMDASRQLGQRGASQAASRGETLLVSPLRHRWRDGGARAARCGRRFRGYLGDAGVPTAAALWPERCATSERGHAVLPKTDCRL